MKIFMRIVAGFFAVALWLLARGMRTNPNALEQTIGEGVHLLGVLILFLVFFQLQRTAVRPPDFGRHQTPLVVVLVLAGGIVLLSIVVSLLLGTFGDEFTRLFIQRQFDPVTVVILMVSGLAALVAAFGVHRNKKWSMRLAKLVVFPFSFGFAGMMVALYTWWVVAPRPTAQDR